MYKFSPRTVVLCCSLLLVLSACAPEIDSAQPTPVLATATVLPTVSETAVSTPPKATLNEFMSQLSALGLTVQLGETFPPHIFSVPIQMLLVNDAMVLVYEYSEAEAALKEAAWIKPDGAEITHPDPKNPDQTIATIIEPAGTPHYFRHENLMVNYNGDSVVIISGLQQVLGPQFAGGAMPIASATQTAVPTPTVTATDAAVPTSTATAEVLSGRWLNAINDVTIYSDPSIQNDPVGTLARGEAARVMGTSQNDWIPIQCPLDEADSCWVSWDYNALYPYEGLPITLTIPDPASLEIESSAVDVSPNGRWQTEIRRSETVSLADDSAPFFYVSLTVTSLEEETTWDTVGEWHAAGLGEEGPPRIFHWSEDGRYVYITSTHDYHGVNCALYDNIGDSFDRLDLTNGQVDSLPPPLTRGILTISSDETWLAYRSGESLVVRNLATAFDDSAQNQSSVKWQIPLNQVGPAPVSQIAWSPDNKQVLVTVTDLADDCQLVSRSTWALDVASGAFTLADQPTE